MERPGSHRRDRPASHRPHSSAWSLSQRGNATETLCLNASRRPTRQPRALRKQNRRQPLTAIDGGLVGRAPGLEELDQLLARPVVIPLAIALDDPEQVIDGLLAAPLGIQRDREIEAGLMVERVRRDLLLELSDRSDRLCLLAQLECRAGRSDRGIVALGFRDHRQGLSRLLKGAGAHVAAREAAKGSEIAAVLRQHLGIEVGCARGVAFGKRVVGTLQEGLFLTSEAVFGQPFDEGDDLALRQGTEEVVDRLAVDESKHCRNRLNTELPRDRGVLVDVHLDELYLAPGGTNGFLQHRCELLAWPAPFRPEIDQDRLAFGFLDYVFDEALRGRFFDHGARRWRLAALQHRHPVRPSSAPPHAERRGARLSPLPKRGRAPPRRNPDTAN